MVKKRQKILIIDDSKLARLTLSRLLRTRGLSVLQANSVSAGIDILKKESDIDAIFMDVMMPKKGGFESVNVLKNHPEFAGVPCSIYSGELSVAAQKKATTSDVQAYLFAPTGAERIGAILDALASDDITSDKLGFSSKNEEKNKQQDQDTAALLAALEKRTDKLARLMTKEHQEKKAAYKLLEQRIKTLSETMGEAKDLTRCIEKEKVERKRADSELRAQLETMRLYMNKVTIVAVLACIIAVITGLLLFVR